MSGSQILADISPNPTLLVKYDTNRGSRVDKPENLWGPCDCQSFVVATILLNSGFLPFPIKFRLLQNCANHMAPSGAQVYQLQKLYWDDI